jgi:hypothetical protein
MSAFLEQVEVELEISISNETLFTFTLMLNHGVDIYLQFKFFEIEIKFPIPLLLQQTLFFIVAGIHPKFLNQPLCRLDFQGSFQKLHSSTLASIRLTVLHNTC